MAAAAIANRLTFYLYRNREREREGEVTEETNTYMNREHCD